MSINAMLVDKINKEWKALEELYQLRTPLWLIHNADEVYVKHEIADTFISEVEDLGFDDLDKNAIYRTDNVINKIYDYYVGRAYGVSDDLYSTVITRAIGAII